MKQGSALLAAETYPWANRTGHPMEKTYSRRSAQDSSSSETLQLLGDPPKTAPFLGLSNYQAICPRQFHFWRLSKTRRSAQDSSISISLVRGGGEIFKDWKKSVKNHPFLRSKPNNNVIIFNLQEKRERRKDFLSKYISQVNYTCCYPWY